MLSGAGGFNSSFPTSLKENQFQYDVDEPLQLQLFGDTAFGVSPNIGSVSYAGNNNCTAAINQPNNRTTVTENLGPHKLQISLSNFNQNNANPFAQMAHPSAVSTGLRLFSEDDEHNSSITSASGSMSSYPTMMSFSDLLKNEIANQKEEIDHYIRVQEEQVIKGLREVNQRQMVGLLAAIERGAGKKLREKELELESITRRNKELNEEIRRVLMESQLWQSRALQSESMVNDLRSKIMQVVAAQSSNQAREGYGDSEVDVVTSHYNTNGGVLGGGFFQSSLLRSSNNNIGENLLCRSCRTKEATVLLLPCRHLCLCMDCQVFIDVCPICRAVKCGSVSVNI